MRSCLRFECSVTLHVIGCSIVGHSTQLVFRDDIEHL